MKKGKMIFIIILLVCVGGVLGILYFNKINKYSYTLNIPSDDSVYSINLEQNGKRIEVSEQDKIKDIILKTKVKTLKSFILFFLLFTLFSRFFNITPQFKQT